MGFLDWLSRVTESKLVTIRYSRMMDNALETLVYMNRNPEIDKEQLIIEAIDEYLQRRLWAAKEKELQATQIQRVPTFKSSGIRQRRQ